MTDTHWGRLLITILPHMNGRITLTFTFLRLKHWLHLYVTHSLSLVSRCVHLHDMHSYELHTVDLFVENSPEYVPTPHAHTYKKQLGTQHLYYFLFLHIDVNTIQYGIFFSTWFTYRQGQIDFENICTPKEHLFILKTLCYIMYFVDSIKKIVELWCLYWSLFRWINKWRGIQKFWNVCCYYEDMCDWISPYNKP